jgi:nucleotide-binding universal stress UspA family protein
MKKILVPTDFSANARRAMHFATRMVQSNKEAHITFFHVSSEPIPTAFSKKDFQASLQEHLNEDVKKLQDSVLEMYRNMLVKEGEINEVALVKYGKFSEEIVTTVQELGIDLVIMGTFGASGLKKVFVGSNTADVMEKVPCSVLAIPDEYSNAPVTRIAYATDFMNVEDGLEKIVSFAKYFNASIELFHVFTVGKGQTDPTTFDRQGFLNDLKQKFGYEHITLAFVKLNDGGDDLIDGIESYVAQKRPSIIAMATYEKMWYETIFKPSKTKQMIFQTTCPLLVIKRSLPISLGSSF